MKTQGALCILLLAAFSLQGCVAALIPLAAAGAIGKTRVDAVKRTRQAEESLGGKIPEPLPEQQSVQAIVTVGNEPPSISSIPLTAESFLNPYTVMVSYALEQNSARNSGKNVRGSVLVENVSLADPQMMPCDNRPMAVLIDIDAGVSSNPMPDGLAEQLGRLRDGGIRVAWIGSGDQHAMEEILGSLLSSDDLMLPTRADGLRKQERRWQLAKDYCVIAAAGDNKADFDELYGYLRVPDYAIRLNAFWNRGWFDLPAPIVH